MKKFIPAFILVLCLIFLPINARADFGNYAGDNDYGGGYDYDYDDYGGGNDYDYGDDYEYSRSGSSSGDIPAIAWIAILGVIILMRIIINKYSHDKTTTYNQSNLGFDISPLRKINEYKALDPDFSEAEFNEKIANLYVRLQNSWQAKDISDLRPYLTDALYAKSERQLNEYRVNGQTNHIERISVLNVRILGWKQDKNMDEIVVQLNTRIVDYVTDDVTGKLVRGSRSAERFMEYQWTLVRTSGQRGGAVTGITAQTCPNCGAKININHSAVCEYCDSVLTTDTFNWTLSNIRGVSQTTR